MKVIYSFISSSETLVSLYEWAYIRMCPVYTFHYIGPHVVFLACVSTRRNVQNGRSLVLVVTGREVPSNLFLSLTVIVSTKPRPVTVVRGSSCRKSSPILSLKTHLTAVLNSYTENKSSVFYRLIRETAKLTTTASLFKNRY
jgi:hypothetical protein